jgi:hypothetical protein
MTAMAQTRESCSDISCRQATREDVADRSESLLAFDQEPPLGAHLVTPRLGFTHHGIYVGGMKVIHYGSLHDRFRVGPVEEVSLVRFRGRHDVRVRATLTTGYSRSEIVARARSRLGENRWQLLSNNCEHFCEWCLKGEPCSEQIENLSGWLRPLLRGFELVLNYLRG